MYFGAPILPRERGYSPRISTATSAPTEFVDAQIRATVR